MGALTVRLAGPFVVLGPDGRPLAVGSRKARRLLARLAASPGTRIAVDAIVADLWPQRPPLRPADNVATLVSRLRAALGTDVVLGGRDGYRLDGRAARTDVAEAADLDGEARRRLAAGDPPLALVAARRGLDLLADRDVLAGEPSADWVETLRCEVVARWRSLSCHLAEAALATGDAATAVAAARAVADEDRLDERAHRLLIAAQALAGEQAPALHTYARLRAALADELGADPAPETQALHVAILRGERAPAAAPPRAAVSRPGTAPAGRETELDALTEAWSAAVGGSPALLLLTGEAGIGKTTLAGAVAALAAGTGGLVASARCYAAERSLPLQPVVDALVPAVRALPPGEARRLAGGHARLLAALLPDVAALFGEPDPTRGDAELERMRVHDALRCLLHGITVTRPVLLLLDDLHNAGLATVAFLHYALARADGCRLLAVATVRSEEGAAALDALDEVASRLAVGPLDPAAVALLAARAGVPRLAEDIVRRTRGHTLFVVETLRGAVAGVEGVPESLQSAVLARVRRVGPDVEQVLRAGAVLGAAPAPATVAAMLDLPLHEVIRRCDTATAARLLVPEGARYEFANDLVQEVLYATTPPPVRLALHRRAADLLADHPEAVADHALALDDLPRVARALLTAGEQALRRYAAADAQALLDRALDAALQAADPALTGRVRLVRARASEVLGHFAAAMDDLHAAVGDARAAGDRRLELAALRQSAGDAPSALGQPERERHLDDARILADRLGDAAALADLLGWQAVVAVNRLRFTDAVDLGRRAVAAGRAASDDAALAAGLDGLKTAYAYLGATAELAPVLDELEPLLRRRGDLLLLRWAVFESALPAVAAADWDRATDRMDEALAINARSGQRSHESWFLAHRGWVERLRGRLDDAVAFGERAVALSRTGAHEWWRATAAGLLAHTLVDLGDRAEATKLLADVREPVSRAGTEAYLLRCLAPLAECGGDPDVLTGAESLLAAVDAPRGHAWLGAGDTYLSIARARIARGDPAQARAVLAPLLAAAGRHGWLPWLAAGELVEGAALAALGDVDAASDHADRARTLADRHGMPLLAAQARALLGELAARGQTSSASRVAVRSAPPGSTGR